MHASPEQLIALRDGDPVDAAARSHVLECAECAAELDTLASLRTRLAGLPGFAVPDAAWQNVVLAVSFALFRTPQSRPDISVAASSATPASVPTLVRKSRYLEDAVMSLNADTDHMVITAGTATTVAALEDRIALVDYEINHAATSPKTQSRLTQLWQQRVNLLQSLAAVRYAQVANSNI